MPRVGRAPPHDAIPFGAEAARDDDAGNAGEQHQRQHLPSQPRHQAADRRQRDQRLADADDLKHHAERARADFVVRVAQRVVRFGVLEAFDVERRGLVEDPQADAILQRVAEQLARRARTRSARATRRWRCRPAARAASPACDTRRLRSETRRRSRARLRRAAAFRPTDVAAGTSASRMLRTRISERRPRAGGPHETRRRREVGQHLPRAHAQGNGRFGLRRPRRSVVSRGHLPQSVLDRPKVRTAPVEIALFCWGFHTAGRGMEVAPAAGMLVKGRSKTALCLSVISFLFTPAIAKHHDDTHTSVSPVVSGFSRTAPLRCDRSVIDPQSRDRDVVDGGQACKDSHEKRKAKNE